MRGWSPPRGASQRRPGAGVLAVNGAAAFKVGFVPDDEAPVLGSAPAPRWRRAPSFTTMRTRLRVPRPSPPRCGDSSALVPARRSECVRCPKRRRSARAPCSAAPKYAENTAETQRKHQVIAGFLGDIQPTEALIPSVLDTPGPPTPTNRPHQHTDPTKTTAPPRERRIETHEQASERKVLSRSELPLTSCSAPLRGSVACAAVVGAVSVLKGRHVKVREGKKAARKASAM